MNKKILISLSVIAAVAAFAIPVKAATGWDLTGTYQINFTCTGGCSGVYGHSMNVLNMNLFTGDFSGTGYYIVNPGYTWTVSGNVTGSSLTYQIVYTGLNPGYTVNATGDIASDGTLSGTATGPSQTFTWASVSGTARKLPYGIITSPSTDEVVVGSVNLAALYYDGDAINDDTVNWAVRYNTCAAATNTVAGNVDGKNNSYSWNGNSFSATIDTSSFTPGRYCFVFNPTDDPGENDVRETRWFNVKGAYSVKFDAVATSPLPDVAGTTVIVTGTIGGTPFTVTNAELPKNFSGIASNTTITYTYTDTVPSTISDKRFRLDSVTGPSSGFSLTADTTITGNYKTQYYLTVKTDPAGIVTIPGEAWYDQGTEVTLTAPSKANVKYFFNNWMVGTEGFIGRIIEVYMNEPKTATAVYKDYLGNAREEIESLRAYVDSLFAAKKIGQKEYDHFMKDLGKVEKDIDKGIKNLDDERAGYDDKIKGFDELHQAIKKLNHMIKDVQEWVNKGKISVDNAAPIIQELEKLKVKFVNKAKVEALEEKTLALKAIEEAQNLGKDTTKAEEEIAKVDEELAKAQQKITEGKLAQAIQHFKHAFAHSQHAIKKAFDPTWSTDYKDWIDELEGMEP
jgi:hypothetical protein